MDLINTDRVLAQKQLNIGLGVVLAFAFSWPAHSGELARAGQFIVQGFDNVGCISEIPLIVETTDVNHFVKEAGFLLEAIEKARVGLENGGCSSIDTLLVTGEGPNATAFEMPLFRKNNWAVDAVNEFIPGLGIEAALKSSATKTNNSNPAANPFNQFNGVGGTGNSTNVPPAPSSGVVSPPTGSTQFDFSQLAFPKFMEALYDGTSASYAQRPVFPLSYLSGVSEALNDQSMLYLVIDQRGFLQTIDSSLTIEISRTMATSAAAVAETTELGMGMLGKFFGTMVEQRKKGATITEELLAINRAMLGGGSNSGDYITIAQAKEKGMRDGRYLALGFDQEPDTFKRLYEGIARFIRQEVK